MSDVAFDQLCAELESLDRERSGSVEWRSFGRAVSRLMPASPLRSRSDVARLLAAAGMRLRPGRRVDYLSFFDRVAVTEAEAAAVAEGRLSAEEAAASGPAVERAERAERALAELDGSDSIEAQLGRDEGGAGSAARRVAAPGEGCASSMDDVVAAARAGEEASGAGTGVPGAHGGGAPSDRAARLRAREEAVRARLRLVSDRPTRVDAAAVTRLMRDRAVRSSARQAFRLMDADGNGVVDAGELRAALRRLRLDLPAAEAEALLRAIDVNGDGVLQWDEWAAFVADREREEVAGMARAASHRPAPDGAASGGNRRGVVRGAMGTEALRRVVAESAEAVDAFPLTAAGARDLVRRLDSAATSFVSTAALERHLLREASRRFKAGVNTAVGADATAAAAAEAVCLPDADGPRAAGGEPPEAFPVPPAVRRAVRTVVELCDTNGDGWVQSDDVAEVGRALAVRTSAGRTAPRMGYEEWVAAEGAAEAGAGENPGRRELDAAATRHPLASDVIRSGEARAAVRDGPALVSEAWLVSDSDGEDDVGAGRPGEAGGSSRVGREGPASLPPLVPRLAIERVQGPRRVVGECPATGAPREAPAAGVGSGVDTTTALSARQHRRRHHAFDPQGDCGGRFHDPVRTARGLGGTGRALSTRSGRRGTPLSAGAGSASPRRPSARRPAAGVAGNGHHGFARKARAAQAPLLSGRSRTARALLSPRFRAGDPDAFRALSARGARVAPTRLGAKAAELAEPTSGVVVPPPGAPAFGEATFVSSARAAMESGLMEDRGARRVAEAEARAASRRDRQELAIGHVLETYRRQHETEAKRQDARLAKVRAQQIVQTERDSRRQRLAEAKQGRPPRRRIFEPSKHPGITSRFTVAPVLVETKAQEHAHGWSG